MIKWLLVTQFAWMGCTPQKDDNDTESEDSNNTEAVEEGLGYIPANYHPADLQRVVYFGDSITTGDGASSSSLDYPSLLVSNDDNLYPGMAGADFSSVFEGFTGPIDESEGGATSHDLVGSQLDNAISSLGEGAFGSITVAECLESTYLNKLGNGRIIMN